MTVDLHCMLVYNVEEAQTKVDTYFKDGNLAYSINLSNLVLNNIKKKASLRPKLVIMGDGERGKNI